jgi:biotin carboxyl carrier protein
MKFEVRLRSSSGNKARLVDLERHGDHWKVLLDGQAIVVDAASITQNTFSILLGGESYEVSVAPTPDGMLKLLTGSQEFLAEVVDPRAWRGRRGKGLEAEGRKEVASAMPGKVIRLLVKAGDKVETGQGLVIVEAMKMQNEIRSPKSGIVGRLFAKEGQSVNAGEILAWVE